MSHANDAAAVKYLREVSALMATAYSENCVVHACRIASHLLRENCSPWIGRLRDVTMEGSQQFHNPLIPLRYVGLGAPTWTAHYVCCSGTEAYDPLVGEPCSVDDLAMLVFGRRFVVREAVSPSQVEELSKLNQLSSHINSLWRSLSASEGAPDETPSPPSRTQ